MTNSLLIKAPQKLNAVDVFLPSSKSISNRLLILNALSYSPYPIKNLSESDDTNAMFKVLNSNTNNFDVGAAGTSMRFLTAYLSKIMGEWTITGSERMKQRPIKILVDALNNLGGKIDYLEKEGYPPLKISGSALTGGELELAGDVSSQYISALLMIAPEMENGLTLRLKGKITSAPYIQLTLKLMEQFGVKSKWNNDTIIIPPSVYKPTSTKVEADWSAASYWFEIMALSSGDSAICLKGLNKYSFQGDAVVAKLFNQLGVQSKFTSQGLQLTKTKSKVKNFKYDFTNEPDLAQTFAVTCAFLDIPFHLTGLHTLTIKETDRISALVHELSKFGFNIKTNGSDNIFWEGDKTTPQSDIKIDTYKDHRMCMAFAPAVLKTQQLTINDYMVVTKSYPKFWEDLEKAGIVIME